MTIHFGENRGYLRVDEYVDEPETPVDPAIPMGEVVRPSVVFTYLDVRSEDAAIKDFTVLLKDDRTVSVRGHGLKLFQPTVPGESGSYGVVVQAAGEEVLVALFKTIDVVGIFSGEIRSDRRIA
jgi:hypothetical protein